MGLFDFMKKNDKKAEPEIKAADKPAAVNPASLESYTFKVENDQIPFHDPGVDMDVKLLVRAEFIFKGNIYGIFKGFIKLLFYTILPLGLTTYIPVQLISEFNYVYFIYILLGTIVFIMLAFIVFYKGLKKYSSTNLMNARI